MPPSSDAAKEQQRRDDLRNAADIWRTVWTDPNLRSAHVGTLSRLIRSAGFDLQEVRDVAGL